MTAACGPFASITVVVCDSVGCGAAPDAAAFGDVGANTLRHVVEATGIRLPNLAALGLGRIPGAPELGCDGPARAAFGRLRELAPAKDTMFGHWELMGHLAERPFPTYPHGFPDDVIERFRNASGRDLIGNVAASGTEIIERLGPEHTRTGAVILYTSGDSVFQLAAHEDIVPQGELYELCELARVQLQGQHAVGRVIARPFVGTPGSYRRTTGRRDYPLPASGPTALDRLSEAGVSCHAIGKIHDIFAGRGIASYEKTRDNADGIVATARALRERTAPFVFVNLVDFDSQYGHRNDVAGYGAALQELDAAVPDWLDALPADGLLLLTADHGNDPTFPGTDHTREYVPLLGAGKQVRAVDLGTRASFADVGATVLENFGLAGDTGESFLGEIFDQSRAARS